MTARRRLDAEHAAYDPGACGADGRAQCRRCLSELPRVQAMFCSEACAHEFRIRASPAYARQAVFRRDRGVCTHCRLDCGTLDRVIAHLRRPRADDPTGDGAAALDDGEGQLDDEGEQTAVWLIRQLGLGVRTRACSLWQADHRLPFSEGGADCGLGNFRTLCLACHRLQTRELHRRQAARRRDG